MVGFSRKDAKRIAKVVRRVERSSINGRPRFRRRSGAVSQRKPHLIGFATVTCDACDLTSPLTSATMPSGTADVHYASGAEWVIGQAGATIFNPTPFRFSSAPCWLKQCGRTWLVDRPAQWTPHAYFGTVGTGGNSGLTTTLFSDLTQRDSGTLGYIASASAIDEINIDCPVLNHQWRVIWGGTVNLSVSGSATSIQMQFGVTNQAGNFLAWSLPGNGAATAGGDSVLYSPSGGGSAWNFDFSGSYILSLSQNSKLKLCSLVTVTGGTLSFQEIRQAWITLEPLF